MKQRIEDPSGHGSNPTRPTLWCRGTPCTLDARCPHVGGPRAAGQADLVKVICPRHARSYAFADGTCPEGPAITVHPVRDEHGEVIGELDR